KGESSRSGTGLLGGGRTPGAIGAGALDMRASNFADTVLGEATHKAVNDIASQAQARAGTLPTRAVSVNGLVADADPNGMIVNVGSKAGVKVGDRLVVSRPVREVRDPATGKVLRRVEDKIGEMVVTEVDEQSASGKFSGAGQPKVGDTVKNQ
ncbi:MAG: curli production assembly protein CsgG, partial [Acidobacteria bacterium]